jgi:UDP-N-acetylglucosamine transferase subunit ALG13
LVIIIKGLIDSSKADEIASRTSYDILIQKGYSSYRPQSARYFDFVPIQTAIEYIRTSELVISHAGIGTIILCKEHGIPLIILPRKKKYGSMGLITRWKSLSH